MARGNNVTLQDLDNIYLCKVLGADTATIEERTGRNMTTIRAFLRCVDYAKQDDWEKFFLESAKGHVGRKSVSEWVESRLNIEIPEEKVKAAPPIYNGKVDGTYPKSSNDDMTADYLMRLLSLESAQAEATKGLLREVKSYAPVFMTELDSLKSHSKWIAECLKKIEAITSKLEGVLHDIEKERSADIKDNINANTEILRQELNTIRNNTRKRGF